MRSYIVFDESTSSVDEDSEREIWECIKGLGKTRTLIIISHRLSTIRNADTIYVFEDGRVTEKGSHHTYGKERNLRKTGDRAK